MVVWVLFILLFFFYFGFFVIVDFIKEFDIKLFYCNVWDRNLYIKICNDILLEEQNMRIGYDVVLNVNE